MKLSGLALLGILFTPPALAQTGAPAACALQEPAAPRSQGVGTVVGIQSSDASRASLGAREAQRGGAIDPRYRNDLRVTVRQGDGIIDNFDVPPGLTAHVGDRVRLQGSYRSTTAACSYIPHMAIPNDAPSV